MGALTPAQVIQAEVATGSELVAKGQPQSCWMLPIDYEADEFSVLLVGSHWPSELLDMLEENGCELDFAESRTTAMMLAQTQIFDYVVVDEKYMRGSFPGFCGSLRSISGPRAIVLAVGAEVSLSAKLEAYGQCGMGVDTWMEHLYPSELLDRIKRAQTVVKLGKPNLRRQRQHFPLQLLTENISATRRPGHRKTTALSQTQLRVLGELMRAGQSGLEPGELCDLVWGDASKKPRLRVQIHLIRQALARLPGAPRVHFAHGVYCVARD